MEKKKPHHDLSAIQSVVAVLGMDAFTKAAKNGAALMGLDDSAALAAILSLRRAMFVKSMTTHMDNTIWQDVYHAPCPNGKIAYVKFTLRGGSVVIQFKEK